MSMTICQPAMFVRGLAPLSSKTPRGLLGNQGEANHISTTAWLIGLIFVGKQVQVT